MLLLRKNTILTHKNATFCYLLRFFSSPSSSSATKTPSPKPSFIQDYLITSCGLSPQKAFAASKDITSFTSAENLESVRHFFKHLGFNDAKVRLIISGCPRILSADVNQILEPNLRALRQMGFSELDLHKLIPRNPNALLLTSAVAPRIDFWRSFLNNDMKKLALALSRNLGLINHDVGTGIARKISLLMEHGLSQAQIGTLVSSCYGFIGRSIASMEPLLKRTHGFGFRPGSAMFVLGLTSLSSLGSDRLQSKMELYKSFGWSVEEFNSAIRKHPTFLGLSDENVRMKMRFLVEKACCSQSYIASHPRILCFSLEKRMMPRYQVLKILKSNELVSGDLSNFFGYAEKTFIERYILRHKEVAPMLNETYLAVCK